MKKLLLSAMILVSFAGLNAGAAERRAGGAVKQPVVAVVKKETPKHFMSANIAGILVKINTKSPEAERLSNLQVAVKDLQFGLATIPNMKDLAPSIKSELTDLCNKMATEAQALLALNTAGDWMPYFIKSPKTSVLKLQELLKDIYAADELINGKTVSTMFKQYVYRPIKNNKMKTLGYVALFLAARKCGVFDLGFEGAKLAGQGTLSAAHWLFLGETYDLKTVLAQKVAAAKQAKA